MMDLGSLRPRGGFLRLAGVMTLTLAVGMAGCSHDVRFMSEPEGADVYVDNIYVGSTPTLWQSRSGLPDTAYVRIEKEGYEPLRNAMIDKTYRADVHLLWLIPGIIPYFLATARYEDDYIFRLKPTEETLRKLEEQGISSDTPQRRETGTSPASAPRGAEAPAGDEER